MKFKDIDIKAITKKSVEQVYESHMPKQIIKEEEEEKGRLPGSKRTLFDLFPFFQTSKKTFSVQNSNYPNEQLFRQIFANIANQDISVSIKNLNNILGIIVREDGSHDFIEDANKRDISESFSALSIISNMYFASKANESMTGHLFEPIIAGLLSGNAVGYKNDIQDIVIDPSYTNAFDGNRITPQQFSLKVIKDKFDLSSTAILARLNDPSFAEQINFNIIVIFKKDSKISNSLASVYNFWKVKINKQNFMKSLYVTKDIGKIPRSSTDYNRRNKWYSAGRVSLESDLKKILITLETFIGNILPTDSKEDQTALEKVIKEKWTNFKNKWLKYIKDLSNEDLLDKSPEAESGSLIKLDPNKIYQDFDETFSSDPEIGNRYKSAKKISAGFSDTADDKIPSSLEEARSRIEADGSIWANMDKEYLGSILLAREVYENRLMQNEGGLVNKFTELLLPLQNALDSTNEYFLQKDVNQKVQNLQKAQQETEKFKQAAENILNPKQQSPLPESLDLTDEAKMVIELLESYNRRNDG